jgi:Ca2+-binding RTX toxin-like protein
MSNPIYIDALLSPSNYRWNNNAPGTPLTVTYGFMTVAPWYVTVWGNETLPFTQFTPEQRAGVDRAVQMFESVANIDFVYRADGDNAQVRFGSAVLPSSEAAHTYYPEPSDDAAGDVWFDSTYSGVQSQVSGSYGFMVTLHEMGHALGLKHSFDGGTILPYDQDNRQYTVMSYNAAASMPNREPATLMLYDIAALQYLYGANTSYKSGNDTWRWNPDETFLACLWDGGGNDTLDASNQTRRVIINLNPGTFSSIGSYQGGDSLNNLSIAFNCWIENATGGSGNDTITGNDLANRLDGGSGNDTITDGDGNDTVLGGGGDDTFYAGFGADSYDGGRGSDVVIYGLGLTSGITINLANPAASTGSAQGDTFVNVEKIVGTNYDDTFVGDASANWFVGGYGNDTFEGGAGADTFDGGEESNTLSYAHSGAGVSVNLMSNTFSGGDAEGDKIIGLSHVVGNQAFYPSIQNVIGSAYDDVLVGSGTFSYVFGGDGNDTLSVGLNGNGSGRLAGGAGNDIYLTGTNFSGYIEESVGGGFDEVRASGSVELFPEFEIEKITFVGTGNFRAWGSSFAQTITGGSGDDSIEGRGGADTLIGNGGNDKLVGDTAADQLYGGDGNDTLDGRRGADKLFGGDGDDVLYYYGDTTGVTIDGGTGFDTLEYVGFGQTIDLQDPMFSGIERINGSRNYADTLKGNDANNVFYGAAGNDYVDGRGGIDTAIYIGTADQYDVVTVNGVTTVTPRRSGLLSLEGVDTLVSVENIQFTGVEVNQAPWVVTFDVPWGRNSTHLLLDRLQILDSQDRPSYQVRDTTAGAGYLTLDGVALPVGQWSQLLTQADYNRLEYHSGSTVGATDVIEVRPFDGLLYGATAQLSIAAVNLLPSLGLNLIARSYDPLPHGTIVAASSMFTPYDEDGDPITRYRLRDGTEGNGYFRVNGVAQPANQVIEVSAAQLSTVDFVPGNTAGSFDYVYFQAFDGFDWGWISSGQIQAVVNAAPVVGASNMSPAHGAGFVAASSMFSVSDGDGDTMAQYEFRDNTTGHGYFRLSGVQQAANFQIAANQLASLQFVPTAATGGQDQVDVRAFDGYAWSAWKSFTVGAVPNMAPAVAPSGAALTRGSASVSAASLIAATDGDGDTMSRYRFFDATSGNGRFVSSGTPQAEGANIEVTAAQLANLQFAFGAAGSSDTVWAQVFDGFAWSTWTSFSVTAPSNAAPAAAVADRTPGRGTASLAAASLVSATDPDGDPITAYKFFDGTQGGGHFRKNGVDQAELVNIDVSAAELATTSFVLGGGTDVLWVQVYDGMSWSTWKSFTVYPPANNAPVVAINTAGLNPGRAATVAASGFFSVSDADNDTITQYRFYDGTQGNGRFELNAAPQAELANLTINASDLANFRYRTSTTGTGDVLWVQAYDGISWSAWKSFNVSAPTNNAPVVSVGDKTPGRGTATLSAASLFSVTDADGDTITAYKVFDGTGGSGHFRKNGAVQADMVNIDVSAAELATTDFQLGGGADVLWVQAYDGISWSAWKSFTVFPPANNAPAITINQASLNPGRGTATVAASSFFSVSDADGDTITQFRFFDGNAGNGRFELSGTPQAELANITISASDLANFSYRTSTTGVGDTLWVQAFDGASWGTWKSFNVAAPQNALPVVTAADRSVGANTATAIATLLSVSDGDGDTITRYQLWDSNPAGGSFRINGVAQAANANIDVMANQLAATDFLSAGAAAVDQLWARANDGTGWGAWKTFYVTTLAPV